MTTLDAGEIGMSRSGRGMTIAGWTLSGLVIAFMTFDSVIKLLDIQPVIDASGALGLPASLDRGIGVLEAICLMLYAWPRTAVLGAILVTGLLGGATAMHLRVLDPLFSHTLFGVYLGVVAWGGLWFRDARLRRLLPLCG